MSIEKKKLILYGNYQLQHGLPEALKTINVQYSMNCFWMILNTCR